MDFNFSKITNAKTRSISAENFTGEKGKGGMSTDGPARGCARELGQKWKLSPAVVIKKDTTFTLADIEGNGMIKHIWMTPSNVIGRFAIIRMYWDNSEVPSVECPVGDFFCSPTLPDFYPVSSVPVCVNPRNGLNCYWDMPFRKNAKITIENIGEEDFILYFQIDYELCDVPDDLGYFHAQFNRENPTGEKKDYTIIDKIEGKGQYVGTYMLWGSNNGGWWGEGEIKFFMDGDDEFPTICGTGTEDYFCGAYGFINEEKYEAFSNLYSGFTPLKRDELNRTQPRFSMYRWHLNDPIRFEKDLKVTIQAIGWRSGGRYLPLREDISSVAFWYQDKPATKSFLQPRDELEII